MASEEYINKYQCFIFDLDNVIYPERDFLLQVYYLFAQFIEYTEQLNAQEIVDYMKVEYERVGAAGLFDKTAARFSIPLKYKDNYDLLHRTARLPLKLLLFEPVMRFMQNLVVDRKKLLLLVSGDPEQQLNKIRQIDWAGLEQYPRVYFSDEIASHASAEALEYLLDSQQLVRNDTLMIGLSRQDELMAQAAGINYLKVDKLLLV
jgi:phosphoglycolate phosphatase-like HAD superfamily hydrolase